MKIDPEFKAEIWPLDSDRYKDLEAAIIRDGCLDPLRCWNGLLLDGHNRLAICEQHGIPYETVEIELEDRDAALDWIDINQYSRRNTTPEQQRELIARVYNRRKKRQYGRADRDFSEGQNDPPKSTADAVAEQFGVSPKTVKRASADYELLEQHPEELEKVRRGEEKSATVARAIRDAHKQVADEQRELEEWNQFAETVNKKMRPANFDPKAERERIRVTRSLYSAIEAIADMPPANEVMKQIPDYAVHHLDALSDVIDWLIELQKQLNERQENERLETKVS